MREVENKEEGVGLEGREVENEVEVEDESNEVEDEHGIGRLGQSERPEETRGQRRLTLEASVRTVEMFRRTNVELVRAVYQLRHT